MDEQQKNQEFADTLGRSRAERMSRIWKDSYPHRDSMDIFKTVSKEAVFRKKAKDGKFTDKEIQMFLNL